MTKEEVFEHMMHESGCAVVFFNPKELQGVCNYQVEVAMLKAAYLCVQENKKKPNV